jgi:hypothetical protein
MAEKLDPQQVVTFEELLRAMMMEQDATRRVLVRKGLLTNEEVLEEIKAVRAGRRGTPAGGRAALRSKRRYGPSRFAWIFESGSNRDSNRD